VSKSELVEFKTSDDDRGSLIEIEEGKMTRKYL
jgi:hypothetical protein